VRLTGIEDSRARNLTSPRRLAYDLLRRVETDDSYINLLLPSLLARSALPEQDRGLIQEISYGSLRWQLQYDALIDFLAQGKPIDPEVRVSLRMGLHQLFRMRVPSHAAINETVELVKQTSPKAAGFANAILRNADRRGFDELLMSSSDGKSALDCQAINKSHPAWMIGALLDSLSLDGRDDIDALLNANNETPRVNLAALTKQVQEQLLAIGLEQSQISPIGFYADGNPEPLINKDVRVQDFGSQIVALALIELADPNGKFLDMCSGPGGKSAVLLSALGPTGELYCYEPSQHRAKLVRDVVGDDSRVKVIEKVGQLASQNTYQAVLLDAPCSGLGSVRRKPESRWRKHPGQLKQLNKLQAELLDAGLSSLTEGGVLLYSTCSPVISETNSQVVDALQAHPEVELVDLKPVVQTISPNIVLNQKRKTIQLWSHIHETDSMFMAAFRRVG